MSRQALILTALLAACSSGGAKNDPPASAAPPAPAASPAPAPTVAARPPKPAAKVDHALRQFKLGGDIDTAVAHVQENRPDSTAAARDASLGEALDAAFPGAGDCATGGRCLTELQNLRCTAAGVCTGETSHDVIVDGSDTPTRHVKATGDAAKKLIDLLGERDQDEALGAAKARCQKDGCQLAAIACYAHPDPDTGGDPNWTCEDSRDP